MCPMKIVDMSGRRLGVSLRKVVEAKVAIRPQINQALLGFSYGSLLEAIPSIVWNYMAAGLHI